MKELTQTQKANLRKWVEALESGEYKQTRATLREKIGQGGIGYCCLGVACDAVLDGKWKGNLFLKVKDEDGLFLEHRLDVTARRELGISVDAEKEYIGMNDEKNSSFAKIAKQIRKNNPEVFGTSKGKSR
jgi:hypothetical protein